MVIEDCPSLDAAPILVCCPPPTPPRAFWVFRRGVLGGKLLLRVWKKRLPPEARGATAAVEAHAQFIVPPRLLGEGIAAVMCCCRFIRGTLSHTKGTRLQRRCGR